MSLQEKIHQLFLLEGRVRGLSYRLETALYQQNTLQKKLDRLMTQQSELLEQLKQTQTTSTSLEHQAQDMEEKIDALRKQMGTITNNREYSALLVEVNTFKLNKSELEDKALAEIARLEELQAQAKELHQQVVEQAKLVEAAKAQVAQRQEEVGAELEKSKLQRDEAARDIPPDILLQFNRLNDQHDGEALTPVAENNIAKMEYNCGGCFMALPLECVNSLAMNPDVLTTCPSCGRFLYIEDTLQQAMEERLSKTKK